MRPALDSGERISWLIAATPPLAGPPCWGPGTGKQCARGQRHRASFLVCQQQQHAAGACRLPPPDLQNGKPNGQKRGAWVPSGSSSCCWTTRCSGAAGARWSAATQTAPSPCVHGPGRRNSQSLSTAGKKMHGLIQVHWPALPFLKEPDNKEKQTLLEFSGGCQVVEIQPMHHLGSEAKAFCWPWKNNNPEMPGKRRSVKQAKLIESSETNAFTKLH